MYHYQYLHGNNDTTQHNFIILINQNELLTGQVKDPVYQINPAQENIVINITNINSTLNNITMVDYREQCFSINLSRITVSSQDPNTGTFYTVGYLDDPLVDGQQYNQSSTPPYVVNNNISMIFEPTFIPWSNYKLVYITLPFNLIKNNTACPSPPYNFTGSQFLNNTFTSPFDYNYDPNNVTQADLQDAVLEVDIGSGYRTATEILIAGLKARFTGVFTGGSSVQFTDQSTPINPPGNPTSWDWDFGDGTPHGTTNIIPPHTYGASGNYSVTLTVTNTTGGSDTSAPQIFRIRAINATAGANGNITPSGLVLLAYGANQAFTVTNKTGYHIADVLVDGVSDGAGTTHTFTNVVIDHNISAIFATYTITPSAGANGAISPSGVVSGIDGANQTFNITPNAGYHIADVLVDGSSVGTNSTYTFTNVQANHTINASFAANARVVIFYDDFNTAFTGWTAGGTPGAPTWFTGSCKNGSHSIQLVNTDRMTRTIPTTGYSSIIVSSALGANSLEAGEYIQAQYNTGAGWTMWAQIIDPGDDNLLHNFNSALPAAADRNAAFQLRFRLYGNSNTDYGYVDDVQVTGIPD
jgi:PKD repeat protein